MLVGEPPVGPDPSLGLRRPDLPVEIETVIRQAVATYREDRFAWAGNLNDALVAALRSPVGPRATSALARGMVTS